jgi:hypothetical protein
MIILLPNSPSFHPLQVSPAAQDPSPTLAGAQQRGPRRWTAPSPGLAPPEGSAARATPSPTVTPQGQGSWDGAQGTADIVFLFEKLQIIPNYIIQKVYFHVFSGCLGTG